MLTAELAQENLEHIREILKEKDKEIKNLSRLIGELDNYCKSCKYYESEALSKEVELWRLKQ